MSSDRFVALYAFPLGSRRGLSGIGARPRYGRFVGDTAPEKLPIRPFWEECLSFEDWQGTVSPRTRELCRELGIDVLFRIHIQRSARADLLLERLEEIHARASSH